jgi:type IV pilus assembly protein PilW
MRSAIAFRPFQARRPSAGLTLVELLVAMALGLLITLAAASALVAARRGFSTVDAASQLRDNARFATDAIQRLAVQVGYKDVVNAATQRAKAMGVSADPPPNVYGFDNAVASKDSLESAIARPANSFGDVLILRYQPAESFPGSGKVDNAMIDCAGYASATVASNRDDTRASVLFVAPSKDGEPTLKCLRSDSGAPPFNTAHSLIRGVENFQVLYGVDDVTPGTKIDSDKSNPDSVPDRYLSASQLTVKGDDAATRANWRRVRSLRIGMVLRSDAGMGQNSETSVLYPLGGAGFASATDVGTIFQPPADGRLRQVVAFTVHLRNDQGL